MFISRALCLFPVALKTLSTKFGFACRRVFPESVTGVTQRKEEVAAFLDVVGQLENKFNEDNGNEGPQVLAIPPIHAPMHDAESIFWLIALFFLRGWPKGYSLEDPNERQRRQLRGIAFESLARNTTGTFRDPRTIPIKMMLPPRLEGFSGMLSRLDDYFDQAWHSLGAINEKHRFHAHNALQSVLLGKIRELEASGDEIEIHCKPLGVDDNHALLPDVKSYLGNKRKSPDDTPDKANKKQKVAHKINTRAMGRSDEKAVSVNAEKCSFSLRVSLVYSVTHVTE